MKKWIVLIVAFAGLPLLSAGEFNVEEAGRIAIQAGGRKKPLDTFAGESLQTISGRRTFKDPQTGQRMGAVDTLLSLWLRTRDGHRVPIVLVSEARLRSALGLPSGERFYSFATLVENQILREFNQFFRGLLGSIQ
mgnify:CR=1 FL=1